MEKAIIVESINKTFTLSKKQMKLNKTTNNKKVAVNCLSFDVFKGEIFGLLGPNGAGKTTTLRMLATLMSPDSGSISIDGCYTLNDIRKKIGFLTSDVKVDDYFTVNYLYDFYSNCYGVDEITREQRKQYYFKLFQLEPFAEMKISTLSTGIKQKVALILSITHDPDIIIFDEPTNGLDIITAKIVIDFLKQCKEMNKTIILSTHILSLAEKLCDRIGIIINGNLVACDTTASLLQHQSLEDLFFKLYGENNDE